MPSAYLELLKRKGSPNFVFVLFHHREEHLAKQLLKLHGKKRNHSKAGTDNIILTCLQGLGIHIFIKCLGR